MIINPTKLARQVEQYQLAIEADELPSVIEMFESKPNTELGFLGNQKRDAFSVIGNLLNAFDIDVESANDEGMQNIMEDIEKQLIGLGIKFYTAANHADPDTVRKFVELGFPINFQIPKKRKTALHGAAQRLDHEIIRTLIGTGLCDYTIRDAWGRTADDVAEHWITERDRFTVEQQEAARLLKDKTREAFEAQGIDYAQQARETLNRLTLDRKF